jgi:PAS domain-containing protein
MDAARLGILAAPAVAVLATDRDGVIRFWNPGAVRAFFPAAEAIGALLDLIIPERLRKRHPSGALEGMAAVIRDVTARFEALRGLRRQLAAQAS